MAESIFNEGFSLEIKDVLSNKDQRSTLQTELLTKYPKQTLIAVKLNIPGPIKNNNKIKQLFDVGQKELKKILLLKANGINQEIYWNQKTGPEYFAVVSLNALKIKGLAVEFEDGFELGRLFDVDVLNSEYKKGQPVSRTDIGQPVRRCLICEQSAKVCARSRKHPVTELQREINEIYNSYFNEGTN